MGGINRNSITNPRRITALHRANRALELRLQCKSFGFIADELGVTRSAVHQMVARHLKRTQGDIDGQTVELRAVQNAQINRAIESIEGDLHPPTLAGVEERIHELMDNPEDLKEAGGVEALKTLIVVAGTLRNRRHEALRTLTRLLERQAKLNGLDKAQAANDEAFDSIGEAIAAAYKEMDEEETREADYTVSTDAAASLPGGKTHGHRIEHDGDAVAE